MLQKDDLKVLYKYPSEHSDYISFLAQIWKYVARYPLALYVWKFENRCDCIFVVGKITMLNKNKDNFMIFKAVFILVFHENFFKQSYVSPERNIDLQPMKLS